uniref:Uncharacterized protein n=1 Tax=Oryza punctata TaxID=4537 RepID=A0A0E0KR56_ORYPU
MWTRTRMSVADTTLAVGADHLFPHPPGCEAYISTGGKKSLTVDPVPHMVHLSISCCKFVPAFEHIPVF